MLSQKALLVSLSISQWTGRKLDKRATESIEGEFSTQKKVGNYTKKLLPAARELESIHAQAGSIRNFFYDNTLPWLADGSRILSSKNYMDFVREFATKRTKFETAVDDFLAVYPSLRAAARMSLGELFNEREYPTEARLRLTFKCAVNFLPMPEVGDFRTEVLDSEKEAFLNSMREVEANATRECFTRLQDVVAKAVEKLNQPDAIFRDSLLNNISSICQILPKLNITDDVQLEAMRRETEALLAGISPENCRSSSSSRAEAAKKLADISDKMSAFTGV